MEKRTYLGLRGPFEGQEHRVATFPTRPRRSGDLLMRYKVVLEQSEEGFAVSVPGLPGCHSQGATEPEALESIADAIQEYLEVVAELNRDKMVREVEVEV
jgi:predicted RNase H-like HicB family nuclease